MPDIPKFVLYGRGDKHLENTLQPELPLRDWDALNSAEKGIALQYMSNKGWLKKDSREILDTIGYLNEAFLRQCPGKHLHKIIPQSGYRGDDNSSERMRAAAVDFGEIFLTGSGPMVLHMLSAYAYRQIDQFEYKRAKEASDDTQRTQLVNSAFEKLDRLANCINHVFEQFAVNQLVTRSGIVPRQDQAINEQIYIPTLRIMSDPKWRDVNEVLRRMFDDHRNRDYAEAITKAHSAVHHFLQILTGENGRNAKGEVAKLFAKAKADGTIVANRFTEPLIGVMQSYFASERATKSTAKPAQADATSSDSILMMNLVMVFLQYCLQVTAEKK